MATNDLINTNPIVKFINDVKNANNTRQREIKLPIDQATTLALTLGAVMGRLEGDLEKFVAAYAKKEANTEIEVTLDGGTNWN